MNLPNVGPAAVNAQAVEVDAAFDAANARRLVSVTWGVAQTVGSAALLFCVYLAVIGKLPGWWITVFFFLGYAFVWGLYQVRAYLLARYLFWASCLAGVVGLTLYFGHSSHAQLLSAPAFLGSLLLFEGRSRLFLGGVFVAAIVATGFYVGTYGSYTPVEQQLPYQGAFFVLAVWVSVDIIERFFALNIEFRERTRTLVKELSERTAALERDERRLVEQTAELNGVNVRLRQHSAQRLALSHQLRGSNEQLEQFAYAASHDLKEPLRSISSFVQLIRRRIAGQPDEQLGEYFDYVVSSTADMTALLDGLLLYSRAGRISSEPESLDLNRVAALLRYEASATLTEAGGDIVVDDLGTVFYGKKEAREILAQLIDNALKFRREGTAPAVHVSRTELRPGWAEFHVRDNGIGIEPDYHERVFQLFQRLNTRDQYAGAGIGLALAKKLVTVAGGAIRVGANPDGAPGITCSFSLPTQAPRDAN